MKVYIMDSQYDISVAVSAIITEQVRHKPQSVLGFATGASPVETYNRLVENYKDGSLSLSGITTFNLDEYCSLSKDDENSYYYFMRENLFGKTDVDFSRVNFLSGLCGDSEAHCKEYREKISAAGGIDIQLLGIGTNGHIGFNEPSESFTDGPYKVKLTESTINSNKQYFADKPMPQYALTMGIGDIMRAKRIILIATGEKKAQAVYDMVKGEVTPRCPASVLQNHPDCTVFVDKKAGFKLLK